MRRVASIIEDSMGGTSGAIYAIFFNAVSNALYPEWQSTATNPSLENISMLALISRALQHGLLELYQYTYARRGHRTLMDALIPFVETLAKDDLDLKKACTAAADAAEGTRFLSATFGRASYVNKDQFDKESGIPDPGALGVVSVVEGISNGIERLDGMN